MKHVLIINGEGWGSTTKESYDEWINLINENLEEKVDNPDDSDGEKIQLATVDVVDGLEKMYKILKTDSVDVIIFMSRSMITTARKLNNEYPSVSVFVTTGLMPKDEIVLVDKYWLSHEFIRNIFLGTDFG